MVDLYKGPDRLPPSLTSTVRDLIGSNIPLHHDRGYVPNNESGQDPLTRKQSVVLPLPRLVVSEHHPEPSETSSFSSEPYHNTPNVSRKSHPSHVRSTHSRTKSSTDRRKGRTKVMTPKRNPFPFPEEVPSPISSFISE